MNEKLKGVIKIAKEEIDEEAEESRQRHADCDIDNEIRWPTVNVNEEEEVDQDAIPIPEISVDTPCDLGDQQFTATKETEECVSKQMHMM